MRAIARWAISWSKPLLTVTTFSVVGVDAVDGEVDVPVVGVAVERIDRLVLAEAHLGEEHPDGLVRLGARRLLTLSPAQDPVLHRLRAAPGDLGEVDHLLHLTVVVDVEEVERRRGARPSRRRRPPPTPAM